MVKVIGFFKRIQYNSPVVLTFTLLAFAVLLLSSLTNNESTVHAFSVYRSSPLDPLFYIRLFGHMLGHSSFEHFFNNFLMILLAGPMLEEKYGSKNMIIMILLTGLTTGLIHIALSSNTMLLGASGIVFMLILLSSFTNLQQGRIPVTLILCIFIFIGSEVVDGLADSYDSISQLGHILGGLCGAVFGFLLNKHKLVSGETE